MSGLVFFMEKLLAFGIFRFILLIIGILFLLNGMLYTVLTKLNIGSNILMTLSVGLIIYAAFLPRIPNIVHLIIGILCLIPVLFIIFLLIYGNTGKPDYSEDVVIVMGAGVIGDRVSRPLAYRLDRAIEYLNNNPESKVVVCGGLGDVATITEAEAMRRYLSNRGIASDRIIKEDTSTSSYENLTFAHEILAEIFPDGYRAVLVSNDFHMFRTRYVASNIGITATHYGAGTPIEGIPSVYFRELLSIANVIVFPPWK